MLTLLPTCLQEGARGLSVADSTLQAVLALWSRAFAFGEIDAARRHLLGLRRMVDLRGGLAALKERPKLAIEVLR